MGYGDRPRSGTSYRRRAFDCGLRVVIAVIISTRSGQLVGHHRLIRLRDFSGMLGFTLGAMVVAEARLVGVERSVGRGAAASRRFPS